MKILVIRNDKLGDFILTLPSFALLKKCIPTAEICALVPAYTRAMAEACPSIDRVLIDDGPPRGLNGLRALRRTLIAERFDCVIALLSTGRTGLAVWSAGIPYRLAPATKLAQVCFNRRLKQRRSLSEKPEYIYNLDLIRHFLDQQSVPIEDLPRPPYLHFPDDEVSALDRAFRETHKIDTQEALVFVHQGSGGSAPNLSLAQYARLLAALHSPRGHRAILVPGPGEEPQAEALSGLLGDTPHLIHRSTTGMLDFAKHVQFADVFISGSTGTLQIAGALDRPTAGFYGRRRSVTALRWQTLNAPERRLAFAPPEDAGELEMDRIDLDEAARAISEKFLST